MFLNTFRLSGIFHCFHLRAMHPHPRYASVEHWCPTKQDMGRPRSSLHNGMPHSLHIQFTFLGFLR